MLWHAIGTYKNRQANRKALVLRTGSYDLDLVARLVMRDEAAVFEGDIAALLDRWGEVVGPLASLATDVAGAGQKYAPISSEPRFAAPFVPRRMFCTASNFVEHANEMGTVLAAKAQSEPYIFMKADTSVIGTGETVVLPSSSTMVDWEVELAAVIGIGGRNVSLANALSHVAAYTIVNDVSARDQSRRTDFPFKNDWFRGKSYDTFGPLGPWLVPSALIADPQDVALRLDVNGVTMQDGSTKEMIFSLAEQIVYLSRILTLRPGDVIATGTPTGVGMGRGIFLKAGDVMTAMVANIGTLTNPVAAA